MKLNKCYEIMQNVRANTNVCYNSIQFHPSKFKIFLLKKNDLENNIQVLHTKKYNFYIIYFNQKFFDHIVKRIDEK